MPSLLLGAAFLATAVWVEGPAAANRPLALGLGGLLVTAGLLALVLPDGSRSANPSDPQSPSGEGTGSSLRRPGSGA